LQTRATNITEYFLHLLGTFYQHVRFLFNQLIFPWITLG